MQASHGSAQTLLGAKGKEVRPSVQTDNVGIDLFLARIGSESCVLLVHWCSDSDAECENLATYRQSWHRRKESNDVVTPLAQECAQDDAGCDHEDGPADGGEVGLAFAPGTGVELDAIIER